MCGGPFLIGNHDGKEQAKTRRRTGRRRKMKRRGMVSLRFIFSLFATILNIH